MESGSLGAAESRYGGHPFPGHALGPGQRGGAIVLVGHHVELHLVIGGDFTKEAPAEIFGHSLARPYLGGMGGTLFIYPGNLEG